MDPVTLAIAKRYTDAHAGQILVAGSYEYPTIQSAIDALPETGGAVYVNPGLYMEAVRITKPNTLLFGTWASIIKTPDNATRGINDCPVRVLAPGCTVENLQIDGNPEGNPHLASQPETVTADGIAIYADHCTVRNNYIKNTLGHSIIVWDDAFIDGGIPAGGRSHIIIEGNLITGPGYRARIDVARNEGGRINRHISILSNRIHDTDQFGIIIHGGRDIIIAGNHLENIGDAGIRPHASIRNLVIEGNILINTAGYAAIHLNYSSASAYYKNVVVANNIIEGSTQRAIYCASNNIEGLIIIGNRCAAIEGNESIRVAGESTIVANNHVESQRIQVTGPNALVEGNVVGGVGGGIRVDGPYATVVNNRLTSEPYGVWLQATISARVSHNRISGANRGVEIVGSCPDTEVVYNRFDGVVTPISGSGNATGNSVIDNNYVGGLSDT